MRTGILAIFSIALGVVSASPIEVPVVSLAQREAGVIDASACFVTAFEKINCAGDVGDNEGVPEGDSEGTCVGTGSTSGVVRHSYSISSACPTLSIFLSEEEECLDTQPLEVSQGVGCWNIVSDHPINSIRFVQPE